MTSNFVQSFPSYSYLAVDFSELELNSEERTSVWNEYPLPNDFDTNTIFLNTTGLAIECHAFDPHHHVLAPYPPINHENTHLYHSSPAFEPALEWDDFSTLAGSRTSTSSTPTSPDNRQSNSISDYPFELIRANTFEIPRMTSIRDICYENTSPNFPSLTLDPQTLRSQDDICTIVSTSASAYPAPTLLYDRKFGCTSSYSHEFHPENSPDVSSMASYPGVSCDSPNPYLLPPTVDPRVLQWGYIPTTVSANTSPSSTSEPPDDGPLSSSSNTSLKRSLSSYIFDEDSTMAPSTEAPYLPQGDHRPVIRRRRFRCVSCPGFCANSKGDLQRHMEAKAHTPPSHVCELCGRKFTRVDALKRHNKRAKCAGNKRRGK